MKLKSLLQLLAAARTALGHTEYVVIGSLSILGMEDVAHIPQRMSMSIDVDAYTRKDPERIFDLTDSHHHRENP